MATKKPKVTEETVEANSTQERDAHIDAETAKRTASYDPLLKDRAKAAGINPDNFDTESLLGEAVEEYERNNQEKEQE